MTTPADLLQHAADLGELLASRARSKQDRRNFHRYRNDPDGFARKVLGVTLWSRQREIVESVRDHDRTICCSANGSCRAPASRRKVGEARAATSSRGR
ncbi:MAG: hypothetical protein ACREMM_13050 [Gemmatimonadales bacterium]